MELYINEEKVSFELENEKNCHDIIMEISDFAANSKPQLFITNILINDNEYSFADENGLSDILIEDIEKIEITTSDVYGITTLSMEQIEKFLELLQNVFLKREWDESLSKLNESLNWMKEGINQIVTIFDSQEEPLAAERNNFLKFCDDFINIISNLNYDILLKNDELVNSALYNIENMIISFNNIKTWLIETFRLPDRDYVVRSIEELIEKIDETIPILENMPVYFQTGEDEQSMNIIQTLADILERSIGLFVLFKESFRIHMDKLTVKEVSFEDFFKTVTDHLKELMEAIKNNDSVMIGDLLEYEFVPNLEEIKTILSKILKEAFTKAN